MMTVLKWIKWEPVAIQGLIQAGLAMAIAFGTPLSTEQAGTIMAFTAAILAVLTRRKTNPACADDPAGYQEPEPAGLKP